MIQLESGKTYVWQWDTKHRVLLTDFPAGAEVHFSNCVSEEAPVVLSYTDGEKVVADIPVFLMQEALDITAYACDQYNTQHCTFIRVIERAKPSDYVYEEIEIFRYAELAKKIPFNETYEGRLLYVVGGVARPLKLGPGLSIRGGTLYVSGGSGAPDEPVGVVVAVSVVDGVEVLTDTTGQIVARIVDGVESVTGPTDAVTAFIDGDVETISSKEVT